MNPFQKQSEKLRVAHKSKAGGENRDRNKGNSLIMEDLPHMREREEHYWTLPNNRMLKFCSSMRDDAGSYQFYLVEKIRIHNQSAIKSTRSFPAVTAL